MRTVFCWLPFLALTVSAIPVSQERDAARVSLREVTSESNVFSKKQAPKENDPKIFWERSGQDSNVVDSLEETQNAEPQNPNTFWLRGDEGAKPFWKRQNTDTEEADPFWRGGDDGAKQFWKRRDTDIEEADPFWKRGDEELPSPTTFGKRGDEEQPTPTAFWKREPSPTAFWKRGDGAQPSPATFWKKDDAKAI